MIDPHNKENHPAGTDSYDNIPDYDNLHGSDSDEEIRYRDESYESEWQKQGLFAKAIGVHPIRLQMKLALWGQFSPVIFRHSKGYVSKIVSDVCVLVPFAARAIYVHEHTYERNGGISVCFCPGSKDCYLV